jgi:uncharacterized protein YecE (DUF72 family)
VLLFQLPPTLKVDLARLEHFVTALPCGLGAAFEFRHPSWLSPAVLDLLRSHRLALCIADTGEDTTPLEVTSDVGYFRLRDQDYSPADLAQWAARIRAATTRCREVFVYFKHEETGTGPAFARTFATALGSP